MKIGGKLILAALALSLAGFLLMFPMGCALEAIAPGGGAALLASFRRETTQDSQGVPVSQPTLQAAAASRDGFAAVKRVAIIGFELSTRSGFVNEMSLNRGPAYKRALGAYEKAFKKHGIDVVPSETLREDPVWKSYDPTLALGQYIESSGALLKSLFTYALPDENDQSGKEFFKALASLYIEFANPQKQISGTVIEAVGKSRIGQEVAKFATETALEKSKAEVAAPSGDALAKRYWAKFGGKERLFYIPVSYRDKPIARTAQLLQTPSAWLRTEPSDEFISRLASSLKVDAVVIIQSCLAWDTEAETPAVGFCYGEPQPIIFYNAQGAVIATPIVMVPPKKSYDAHDKDTKAKESELMAKHPEVMPVMMKTQAAYAQVGMNKGSAAMFGFATKWMQTYIPPQIAVRTELDLAGASQVKRSIEVYRAVVYEILDQMFQLVDEKQKFTQTMSQEQMSAAMENLSKLYDAVGWEPQAANLMAGVDELAEKEVNAILKPLGN